MNFLFFPGNYGTALPGCRITSFKIVFPIQHIFTDSVPCTSSNSKWLAGSILFNSPPNPVREMVLLSLFLQEGNWRPKQVCDLLNATHQADGGARTGAQAGLRGLELFSTSLLNCVPKTERTCEQAQEGRTASASDGEIALHRSVLGTINSFCSMRRMLLFPNCAEPGDLNPKAKLLLGWVSYTIDSSQSLPTFQSNPCQECTWGNSGALSKSQLTTEGFLWKGSELRRFLEETAWHFPHEHTAGCCSGHLLLLLGMLSWVAGLETWSKDSIELRYLFKYLLLCPEKLSALMPGLQRKASKYTTSWIMPFKYCACPQTLIVPLGTEAVDAKRHIHHFCIASTFQGKNSRWEKRDSRTALILILVIMQCPSLPQIKIKDASSKLYSKIIMVKTEGLSHS